MLIDLSVALNEQTPIYPGDPATSIKLAGDLDKDGYCDHYVSIGTHVGTHMDAPMHMLEGGQSLDKVPIKNFVGNGCYIEVQDGDFSAIKSANIQEGDIVLFHTGMSDKYHDDAYFENYPAMSEDIAQYLVEKKVKIVGVDECSVDNKDGFPIHKILLGGGTLIIENLTNLSQLKGKEFQVYALPIKLQIDGAPARVIAEVKS
ncbi:MAG TPA: cyclase family protein [Candidatus Saccharimonadales bacterium]|nr:cyclase family protein [Candidatus Saccharimonadales bacterium]